MNLTAFSEHRQSRRYICDLLVLMLGPGITLSSNSSTNPTVPLVCPRLGHCFCQSGTDEQKAAGCVMTHGSSKTHPLKWHLCSDAGSRRGQRYQALYKFKSLRGKERLAFTCQTFLSPPHYPLQQHLFKMCPHPCCVKMVPSPRLDLEPEPPHHPG